MKNSKLRSLIAFVFAVVFLAGCGIGKMAKKYETVGYDVTPKVLETHGGKIAVTIKGQLPEKYFHKKAVVEVTPVLKYEGGSTPLKTLRLKGEKAEGEGEIISKTTGGSFTYTHTFDYTPAMNASELIVEPKAYIYNKPEKAITLGTTKLADGVIYTSERIGKDEDVIIAPHGYQKVVIISKKANLYYAYNKANLNMNLELNKDDKATADIAALKEFIEQNWKIKSIEIDAWASPEGELSLNEELSENRGKATLNYFVTYFKKLYRDKESVIKYEDPENEVPFKVAARGEDFNGFMSALRASNIQEKSTIENVIKSQATKGEREKQIKNMTVIYEEVEQMLSVLRRAEITVSCFEPKRSDENIAELSTTHPDSLKVDELLYAGTLTEDLETQYKIYKSATKLYGTSWEAYNNAGMVALQLGEVQEAKVFLEKAKSLNNNEAIIMKNLGVVAAWERDWESAKEYYAAADEGGVNCDYNMAVIKIKEGDYNGALTLFRNVKCRYNVALAQLLNGNPSAAASTLECLQPKTAEAYYLMAVVGARTNNLTFLLDNLKKAVKEDPSYKKVAAEDREFLKYFDNAEFVNVVK